MYFSEPLTLLTSLIKLDWNNVLELHYLFVVFCQIQILIIQQSVKNKSLQIHTMIHYAICSLQYKVDEIITNRKVHMSH